MIPHRFKRVRVPGMRREAPDVRVAGRPPARAACSTSIEVVSRPAYGCAPGGRSVRGIPFFTVCAPRAMRLMQYVEYRKRLVQHKRPTSAGNLHPSSHASKDVSWTPRVIFFQNHLTRPARTREHQTLNLIIPINFPVVVVIALLLPERHRLVLVVLLVLLDGSLVVLRRRQRGHPPRIHQPLLAVHAC